MVHEGVSEGKEILLRSAMEVPTAQQLASDRENEAPILERHDHNLEPGDPAATANPSVGNVTTGVLELSSVGIETRDPWELGQWSLLSPSHPPATTWLKHQTVGFTVSPHRLCYLHLLGAAQALPLRDHARHPMALQRHAANPAVTASRCASGVIQPAARSHPVKRVKRAVCPLSL